MTADGSGKPHSEKEAAGEVVGDTDAAIDFLKHWAPLGLWVLCCDEKDTLLTRTFTPAEEKQARAWIDERQGRYNIYFSPNQPRGRISKKASKLDIGSVVTLHVDFDPAKGNTDLEKERERLFQAIKSYPLKPSVVVDSGGGYWAFWRLNVPQELPAPSPGARLAWKIRNSNGKQKPAPEDATDLAGYLALATAIEEPSRAIAKAFGADNCFNIDRVARLPGTINVPSEKKIREKGQRRSLARVVRADWNLLYAFDAFSKAPADEPRLRELSAEPMIRSERRDPADWCLKVITDPLCNPDGKHDYQGHRARAAFAICCELVRCGWSDDDIAAKLTDEANGISEHVQKQKPSKRYVAKTIARARDAAENDFERYADGPSKGEIIANSQLNIRIALARLGIELSHDEFARRYLIQGPDGKSPRSIEDAEAETVYLAIDERLRFRPSYDFFIKCLRNEARRNSFHPVSDYLGGLVWDNTPRIDTWLIDYGGAADTPYVRAVGRLMLIAAVRRVRQPGCKFDEMPVLESPQGKNKSMALRRLAVREEWFTDALPLDASGQKAIEIMMGKWIIEAGELQGLSKGDVEHLKAFLSRQVDRARLAYDRMTMEYKRDNIVVGTTNADTYLRDTTGNRRFWPVACKEFELEKFDKAVDQLWAEASAREAKGESIRLDPELYPAAAEEQEARRAEDPWEAVLDGSFGKIQGKIACEAVWQFVGMQDVAKREQRHKDRLGACMKKLGWKREKLRLASQEDTVWCYWRGDRPPKELCVGSGKVAIYEPPKNYEPPKKQSSANGGAKEEPEDWRQHHPPQGEALSKDDDVPM